MLGDEQSGIKAGEDAFVLKIADDLTQQAKANPRSTFLLALHQWRQMMRLGPDKFGQSTYWGEVQGADGEPYDLMVATRDILESNLLFAKSDGRLRMFESFLDLDQDPCTLEFTDYQMENDVMFPASITFRIGNGKSETISLEKIELGEPDQSTQDSDE